MFTRALVAALLLPGLPLVPWGPRSAHGDPTLVGAAAPALEVTEWLAAPDGTSLSALGGRVVLLLHGGAGNVTDTDAVLRWNDLRAAYFEKGLRVVAVLDKKPAELPPMVEYSAAVGSAAAYGSAAEPRAALIEADGKVAWAGEASALPEDVLGKLLRKTRMFRFGPVDPTVARAAAAFKKGQLAVARDLAGAVEHPDAKRVVERISTLIGYWEGQVVRATSQGNPAEAALHLRWLARHLADAPEGTEAAAKLKALKADKAVGREIKAAPAYARLRGQFLKTKGKRKRIDALVKKAERFAERNKGTRGAERAARLAAALKSDPALATLRAFIAKEKVSTKASSWRTSLPKPPNATFAGKRKYHWHLETSAGRMKLELWPAIAPMHVSSLIYLTELGFFDGLTFHRVIPGFMAQGGCPAGSGSGDPGYKFDGEFADGARHDRCGILSAAHAGPGTDGSQFFITFGPAAHLDNKHTVYGVLVSGEKTLKKIEKLGSAGGSTSKRIVIEKATITVD